MSQGCRPTNPVHPSFSCKEGTITPLHIEALGVILSVEADEATEILQAYADVMEIGNIKAINIRDCVTTNTVVEALLIASRIFILHEYLSYRICKDVAEPVRGTLYRQARIAARNWGLGSKGQPHLAEESIGRSLSQDLKPNCKHCRLMNYFRLGFFGHFSSPFEPENFPGLQPFLYCPRGQWIQFDGLSPLHLLLFV